MLDSKWVLTHVSGQKSTDTRPWLPCTHEILSFSTTGRPRIDIEAPQPTELGALQSHCHNHPSKIRQRHCRVARQAIYQQHPNPVLPTQHTVKALKPSRRLDDDPLLWDIFLRTPALLITCSWIIDYSLQFCHGALHLHVNYLSWLLLVLLTAC